MEQLQTRMTFELTEDSYDLSDPITLGEAIELFQFTPKRFLDLSHKLIHSVGNLHRSYTHLKQLNLCFNYLSDLNGLQSLQSLEILLISHNCLKTLSSTTPLSGLRCLHTLDLRYNPVTQETHYRMFTIAANPNLSHLDQVPLTFSDRRTAEKQFAERTTVVQALVKNSLACFTLDGLRHRLDLHAELIRKRQVSHYSPVDVHLFLRLVQPPETLSRSVYETVLNTPEHWTRDCLFAQKQQFQSALEDCSLKTTQCSQLLESYQQEIKPNRRYQLYDERVNHKSLVRFSVRQLNAQLKLKIFYAWKLLVRHLSKPRPTFLKEALVHRRMDKLEKYLASHRGNSRSGVKAEPRSSLGLRTKFYLNTPVDNRMRSMQRRTESRVWSSRLLQDVYQRLEAVEAKLSLRY